MQKSVRNVTIRKKVEPTRVTQETCEELKMLEEGDAVRVRRVNGTKAAITGTVTGFE